MKVAASAHVPPFAVMEILAAANARRAAGEDVLNLCAGEPSTGASDVVRQRAIDLLTAGGLGYTEALGIPALRAAIARHYRDWYGVDVDPAGSPSPPARPAASCSRSSRRSTSATAWRWPVPATRRTRTSCRARLRGGGARRAARRPGTSRPSRMLDGARRRPWTGW